MNLEMVRPGCIDDAQWTAIEESRDRTLGAVDRRDWPLALGSAKELCETVAKIAWLLRGRQFGANTDYGQLVAKAHEVVYRIPGTANAAGSGAREIADVAMRSAKRLGEFRNLAGTGHGRPEPVSVDEEDARFAVGTAILWSRWMLARLDAVVVASPEGVANDFRSIIFYSGDATKRLTQAGLDELDPADQRLIGVAVGQRAASGTMTVAREGVVAPSHDPDLVAWPAEYRRGVVEGLFIDRNGYLAPIESSIGPLVVRLLAPLEDAGAGAISELADRIKEAEVAYAAKGDARSASAESMREAATATASASLAAALRELASSVETPAP